MNNLLRLFNFVIILTLVNIAIYATGEDRVVRVNKSAPEPVNTEDGTWAIQNSGFTQASRGINHISVVDANNVWAQAYDGVSTSNYIVQYTRTTNGGTTWTPISISGYSSGWGSAMINAVSGTTAWVALFNASSGGGRILKTTDGGTSWTHQNTATFSAPAGFPNVVHFFDANNGYCMGDPNGGYFEIYTTTDGGTNWTRVPTGNIPAPSASDEYGVVGYYSAVGNTTWFTTNKGRVFKSTDKGLTWTVATTPAGNNQIDVRFRDANYGIVMNPSNGMTWKSTDGGSTWALNSVTSGFFYTNDYVFIPGTSNAMVSTGAATGASGVSYSLNGGSVWTDFTGTTGTQYLATGFLNNFTGWAGGFNTSATVGGMYKFTGFVDPTIPVEFTSFSAQTSENSVTLSWATATETNNYGFEVQRSTDNKNFVSLGFVQGKGTTTVPQSYIFTDRTDIKAKIYYRLKQIDLDGKFNLSKVIEVDANLPTQFSLSQNYPNPFNPSTAINFSVPQAADVNITVYNTSGEAVATIANGVFEPGFHQVVWNAQGITSGVYFYTIKAGNFTETKKLMLMK